MSFSVLMSLYAKEQPMFLHQSLKSVFDQTLLPNEVILVEDGPIGDELQTIVNDFSKQHNNLKIIKLPINGGLGSALNEGLKYCSNELIVRCDTDDINLPNRFEKQIKFMESHPEIACCSAWIQEFDHSPENPDSIKKLPETSEELYEYGKYRCPINHPAAVFRKDSVIKSGGYIPFYLFEDYHLWVRMLMNGYKFYNLQTSLLSFRASKFMFGRRGGLKYAKSEIKLQRFFLSIKYISIFQYLSNITLRLIVRLLPNSLRTWTYRTFLR